MGEAVAKVNVKRQGGRAHSEELGSATGRGTSRCRSDDRSDHDNCRKRSPEPECSQRSALHGHTVPLVYSGAVPVGTVPTRKVRVFGLMGQKHHSGGHVYDLRGSQQCSSY
jgi:hypothetical protein